MSWQYDDNSNRTQQNKDNRQQQYHYNANQELIEISSDEQTTYYQYDPNGALIEQSGSNPKPTNTTATAALPQSSKTNKPSPVMAIMCSDNAPAKPSTTKPPIFITANKV